LREADHRTPIVFFAFLGLAVCRKAKAPLIGDIDACEIFAGVGSVTSALKASTVKKKITVSAGA